MPSPESIRNAVKHRVTLWHATARPDSHQAALRAIVPIYQQVRGSYATAVAAHPRGRDYDNFRVLVRYYFISLTGIAAPA